MVRIPVVIGLTLCEKMEVNSQTRQVSLVGIFQARQFRQFPSDPWTFTVYAALHGGIGEGTMELMIQRQETEEDIKITKRWMALPGRQLIVNLEIRVRNCVFPAPGRYTLRLRFDNQDLTIRHLDIYRGT